MDPDQPATIPNRRGVPQAGDVAFLTGWHRTANPHPALSGDAGQWDEDWDYQARIDAEVRSYHETEPPPAGDGTRPVAGTPGLDFLALDNALTLRRHLAEAAKGYQRLADPVELAAWLLTGDRHSRAMPTWMGLRAKLDVLLFVARAQDAEGLLGTVADPVAAAEQLLAWLQADTIGPIPRHWDVTVRLPGQDSQVVRVASPPASSHAKEMPEDAL